MRPGRDTRATERGVALLNALVILAVIAGLAAVLLREQTEARHVIRLMLRADQARHYAIAAESLALEGLEQDFENNDIDHLGEAWAEPDRSFAVEEGRISGTIKDLQGRVDLNLAVLPADEETGAEARINSDGYRLVARVLEAAGAPAATADRLVEWILLDSTDVRGAVGDAPYVSRETPYRRAGQALFGLSEARLIDGVDAAVMARLEPIATALTPPAPVNVNTAPRAVLAALFPGASKAALDRILRARADEPYASVDAFLDVAGRSMSQAALQEVPSGLLSVRSEWFELTLKSTLDGVTLRHTSIIHRDADTGKARVTLRSRGPV